MPSLPRQPGVKREEPWAPVGLTADELYDFHERAAIMEHDGQLAQEVAERKAWVRVMRARPATCSAGGTSWPKTT